MLTPSIKLLVIEPDQVIQKRLSELLISQNIPVTAVSNIENGIQQVLSLGFDIVICQNKLGEFTGFQIYEILEKYLVNSGAAFFLLSDNFEAEDLLIGSEIGIDGFLFTPLNAEILLRKLNRHIDRVKKGVFNANRFNTFFENSPVAKFIAENEKIINFNEPFKKIFDLDKKLLGENQIRDFFDLDVIEQNRLKFKKLKKGLLDYCCLKKVEYKNNSKLIFDIHLYSVLKDNNSKILAEIIPVGQESIYETLYRIYPEEYKNKKELDRANGGKNNISLITLTRREKEIFAQSAKGYAVKQIASNLNLSERTVEKHRSNIMNKTNSHSILEAILIINNNSPSEIELNQ